MNPPCLHPLPPPDAYMVKLKNRFVVLTHESLHWFKRSQGYDLFGEERGSIALSDISSCEKCQGRDDLGCTPDTCFIITTTDFLK